MPLCLSRQRVVRFYCELRLRIDAISYDSVPLDLKLDLCPTPGRSFLVFIVTAELNSISYGA